MEPKATKESAASHTSASGSSNHHPHNTREPNTTNSSHHFSSACKRREPEITFAKSYPTQAPDGSTIKSTDADSLLSVPFFAPKPAANRSPSTALSAPPELPLARTSPNSPAEAPLAHGGGLLSLSQMPCLGKPTLSGSLGLEAHGASTSAAGGEHDARYTPPMRDGPRSSASAAAHTPSTAEEAHSPHQHVSPRHMANVPAVASPTVLQLPQVLQPHNEAPLVSLSPPRATSGSSQGKRPVPPPLSACVEHKTKGLLNTLPQCAATTAAAAKRTHVCHGAGDQSTPIDADSVLNLNSSLNRSFTSLAQTNGINTNTASSINSNTTTNANSFGSGNTGGRPAVLLSPLSARGAAADDPVSNSAHINASRNFYSALFPHPPSSSTGTPQRTTPHPTTTEREQSSGATEAPARHYTSPRGAVSPSRHSRTVCFAQPTAHHVHHSSIVPTSPDESAARHFHDLHPLSDPHPSAGVLPPARCHSGAGAPPAVTSPDEAIGTTKVRLRILCINAQRLREAQRESLTGDAKIHDRHSLNEQPSSEEPHAANVVEENQNQERDDARNTATTMPMGVGYAKVKALRAMRQAQQENIDAFDSFGSSNEDDDTTEQFFNDYLRFGSQAQADARRTPFTIPVSEKMTEGMASSEDRVVVFNKTDFIRLFRLFYNYSDDLKADEAGSRQGSISASTSSSRISGSSDSGESESVTIVIDPNTLEGCWQLLELRPQGLEEIAQAIYFNLLSQNHQLQSFFYGIDMEEQGRSLVRMLCTTVHTYCRSRRVQDPVAWASFQQSVIEMGARHRSYGIGGELFLEMQDAFFKQFPRFVDANSWRINCREWHALWDLVVRLLKEGGDTPSGLANDRSYKEAKMRALQQDYLALVEKSRYTLLSVLLLKAGEDFSARRSRSARKDDPQCAREARALECFRQHVAADAGRARTQLLGLLQFTVDHYYFDDEVLQTYFATSRAYVAGPQLGVAPADLLLFRSAFVKTCKSFLPEAWSTAMEYRFAELFDTVAAGLAGELRRPAAAAPPAPAATGRKSPLPMYSRAEIHAAVPNANTTDEATENETNGSGPL